MPADALQPAALQDQRACAKRNTICADFLLYFALLLAPYLVFADGNRLLWTSTSMAMAAILAGVAFALALVGRIWPSPVLRAALVAILVLLFVDTKFDIEKSRLAWLVWTSLPLRGETLFPLAGAMFFAVFWAVRGNIGAIATTVGSVICATTLALAAFNSQFDGRDTQAQRAAAADTRLPVYVHLVLDEHIGLAAMNASNGGGKFYDGVADAYVSAGFRIFPRAFSQFYYTRDSLAAMLNYRVNTASHPLITDLKTVAWRQDSPFRYRLNANAYFDGLRAKGYRLNVYQTNWLDFCGYGGKRVDRCATFPYSVNAEALRPFAFLDRLRIVLYTYAKLSFLAGKTAELLDTFGTLASPADGTSTTYRTTFRLWRTWIGPPVAMPAIDRLIADIEVSKGGDMFFAHVLLPHHPYSVDENCAIRKPIITGWFDLRDSRIKEPLFNTRISRAERYRQYWPQVLCAAGKVRAIVHALQRAGQYERAVFIVHGDHGSKIAEYEPIIEHKDLLQSQDYFDSFSTLFAIKAPGVPAGSDHVMASIVELLARFTAEERRISSRSNEPKVLVYARDRGEKKKMMHELPMPELPVLDER